MGNGFGVGWEATEGVHTTQINCYDLCNTASV